MQKSSKKFSYTEQKKLGEQELNNFFVSLNKIETEYEQKYMFYSTAIELQKLKSFNKWLSDIIKDKDILTPIIVDRMVNEEDLGLVSILIIYLSKFSCWNSSYSKYRG